MRLISRRSETTSSTSWLVSRKLALDGPTTRFHRSELNNQTLFRDGTIRVVGSWTSEGHPPFDQQDRIQAVFLKIDLIPAQEEEVAVEALECH